MTPKGLLTSLSLILLAPLSAPYLFSQQPASPPSPLSGTLPGQPAPPPPSHRYMRGNQMSPDNFRGPGSMGMHPGSRIAPSGMWWKNPNVIQRLSLTDDQQKKMDGIFQQSRIQLIDLKAGLEKQEVILEPMLDANPPDTNKVLAQIDNVAQARAELEKANAKMLLGIRGVLTADQWTKLQTRERGDRSMMFNGKNPPGSPGGPEGQGGPGGRTGGRGSSEIRSFPLDPL